MVGVFVIVHTKHVNRAVSKVICVCVAGRKNPRVFILLTKVHLWKEDLAAAVSGKSRQFYIRIIQFYSSSSFFAGIGCQRQIKERRRQTWSVYQISYLWYEVFSKNLQYCQHYCQGHVRYPVRSAKQKKGLLRKSRLT